MLLSEPETVDVVQGTNTDVNPLRTILGDDHASPVYIETVIGTGYRFITTVTAVEETADRAAGAQVEDSSIRPALQAFSIANSTSNHIGSESAVLTQVPAQSAIQEDPYPRPTTGSRLRS